jgi:hypothetical protein
MNVSISTPETLSDFDNGRIIKAAKRAIVEYKIKGRYENISQVKAEKQRPIKPSKHQSSAAGGTGDRHRHCPEIASHRAQPEVMNFHWLRPLCPRRRDAML